MTLPYIFPRNLPGTSSSSPRNQLPLMPNTNTMFQPFTNPLSLSPAVPLHSSTTNQIITPNTNAVIESLPLHSDTSPHPYELVPLPPRARKCYAWEKNFTDEYRSPPQSITVKHVDQRVIQGEERAQ